jgi:DNA ligase (NAD+)
MDIEGMGEAVVRQLVQLKLVKTFADIYTLREADLLKLELFKDKKADNLLRAIEKSKAQSLERLIYGLGIRHVGEKAAYVLAKTFKIMEKLALATIEDLEKIPEIGPVIAESVLNYFSLPQTRKLIQDLKGAGLNFKEVFAQSEAIALSGKTVVFTGTLKGFTRPQAEELLRRLGVNVSSSVSKNTDFVIAGENAGAKLTRARKLGVKIIDEEKFKEMIK